ncbi:MAG: hypothetical protein F6J95_026760 [Leptolyngbya sp. SIO1E4]|nr:hypothetical protein [Leptolyngbya sp. SIO1E4]
MDVISKYLNDLRRIFSVWSSKYEDEYDLLWFAYYESCQEQIMANAAPYVVGNSLVKSFGFHWVMVQSDSTWHHGVSNPILPEPIDLLTLEDGDWYRPEPNDEPPEPGEATLDSRDVIILVVKWKQIKGCQAPIPKGSYSQLEEQVAHAQIFGNPEAI